LEKIVTIRVKNIIDEYLNNIKKKYPRLCVVMDLELGRILAINIGGVSRKDIKVVDFEK
jgi:hypothetical protein